MTSARKKKSLSVLLDAIVARSRQVSALLIVVGLVGLAVQPLLERKVNFDENALLAGSARPTIRAKSPDAYKAGKDFASCLSSRFFSPAFTAQLQQQLQLQQHFRVDVYNHTFTVPTLPAGSSTVGPVTCTNVHAVLVAPKGDGKEALVLVTPINHQQHTADFEQDASGAQLSLALGHALLSHLASSARWLAKDVIWVLPDASCGLTAAMQAWAGAYQQPGLLGRPGAADLPHFSRSGMLQQALVLETPTGSFNALQVGLEGYDGALPKLDMYWLIRWYCWNYVRAPVELPHMYQQPPAAPVNRLLDSILLQGGNSAAASHPAVKALQQHLWKLTTFVQFMWRQARGVPTGGHAPFKGLMVDAATLRVLAKDPAGHVVGPVGFRGAGNIKQGSGGSTNSLRRLRPQQVVGFDDGLEQLGNVVELLLRSCNVLIEKFHHSLFLYVLSSLDHYVSVERYIGPLVALIGLLLLQAAAACSQPAAAAAAVETASASAAKDTTPSAAAQAEGSQQQQQEEEAYDEVHDMLCLAPAEVTSASLAEWAAAIRMVAAVHMLAAAVGYGLRQAPLLLPLLQPQAALAALAAATAAPDAHKQQIGVVCGLMLLLMAVWEGLRPMQAVSGAGHQGPGSHHAAAAASESGSSSSSSDSFVRKVVAVELSAAAAVLAAVACVNWALGFAVCMVLVPLAVLCAPLPHKVGGTVSERATESSSRCRWGAWLVLLCCAPPCVLLLLSVVAAGSAAAGVTAVLSLEWLQWVVLESSLGTHMVFCGVYAPCWGLTAWQLWLAQR